MQFILSYTSVFSYCLTLTLFMMEILVGGAEVIVALAWSTTEGLKRRAIPPPRTGSRAASSVGLRVCSAAGVGERTPADGDTKSGVKSKWKSVPNTVISKSYLSSP